MRMEEIEARFKEVTGIEADLTKQHLEKGEGLQQKTSEESQKKFGFITTPLWLCDFMIEPQIKDMGFGRTSMDACAGCGQFSIRILRKLHHKYNGEFDVDDYLRNWHYFNELQFTNVAKLVYIFGTHINVFAGNALNLKYLPDPDYKGVVFFDESKKNWFNYPSLAPALERFKDDLDTLVKLFQQIESVFV